MPLVGCPCRGPPLKLAGRAQRPPPPRATATKCGSSSPPALLTRRAVSAASLLLAALPVPASSPQLSVASASEAEAEAGGQGGGAAELELERYTDQDQGFTLLKPASWPKFVVDRLLQAEKKKESTKSAQVISAGERSGHGGLTVYEIEYSLDSTRGGMKRIFSAVFVASRKLYLLNIAYSDAMEKPLDSQTRLVLEQVLRSFDSV